MKIILLIIVFFSISKTIAKTIVNPVDSLTLRDIQVKGIDVLKDQFKMHDKFAFLDKKYPLNSPLRSVSSNDDFTFARLGNEYSTPLSVTDGRQEASTTMTEITEKEKWVDSFSGEDVQSLPLGIQKEISGVTYQLGFAKAKFTKDYTELTVFARIILPQTDEEGKPLELFFGANNVKLTHGGGLVGDANLVLLGDVYIPFNSGNWLFSLKGGFDKTTGVTENTTYVTIDCDGVKELALMGEVQFSREMLLPVDSKGLLEKETRSYTGADEKTIQIPNRVRGAFNIVATDWNNMVVEINLSPFVLAKHPDKFMFSVNQAVFDFSDYETPDIQFPNFYYSQNLLQPTQEAWRGVYVRSLEIGMPQEFKTDGSISENKRVTFSASNMVIDNYGLSGYFSAENVISLDSGRTSDSKAWQFSVDKIGIELAASNLVKADFEGAVLLPVSNVEVENSEGEKIDKLGLGYQGIISEEEYMLNVSTLEEINFDIWQAQAQLEENSSVELLVKDGNFRPRAILNGNLSISAKKKKPGETSINESSDKSLADFKGIKFQNLVLQTETPIFQADYFGYEGEVKLANFPVSIADIGIIANGNEASLSFDLSVSLMGESDKGFGGTAGLKIVGEVVEENRKQKWKYKDLELSKIEIEANMGAIKLSGGLELMQDDPEYGDGFSAEIEGTFGSFGPINTKAIFGKKDFRYWYVDASIDGLKINVGPMQLSGFAGGASYRMTRRAGVSVSEFSPSGLSYIPSTTAGLGLKAMVKASIADESTLAIGAGFEIQFNKSMGVNSLGFFGEVKVMKALSFANPATALQDQLAGMVDLEAINDVVDSDLGQVFLDKAEKEYPKSTSEEATIEGKIGINFDFENSSFHSDMELYVNTPGGFLQGIGPGGLAGWGVVHVDSDEWYAYLGTPSNRVGLRLGVGPVSVETGGYFMVGDRLEGSPPPPPEVAEILGVDVSELDYMRDENALSSGKGFAFGTSFKVDTGDLRFLVFYARFMAGAGYDIMLRDYGEASCSNTGKQIGIDGWYANGQAYAYLQGELGINIKLFFIKKKIPIIEAGAAVLLQAKAPNPIWIQGYLGGYYSLLGGMVKGSFRFKLVLGEECVLENASPLGGIKMISDLSPKDGADEVDVFAAPQAAFNMKVNEPIIIPEDSGDNTYKVLLEKMEVKDPSGKIIEGELEWNQTNDRVTFFSTDILPPNTDLTVTAEVSFQEKKDGVFQTINVDGQKAVEIEVRTFKTGTAPTYIPLTNVEYCYPVVDQKFVYTDEYPTGYIQLKRGQDYLFDDTQWKSEVALIDASEKSSVTEMNYSTADNQVFYTMPKLQNETGYELKITSSPNNSSGTTSSSEVTTVDNMDADNSMEITQKSADNVSKDGVIDRLDYQFATSKYDTFKDKMKSINVTRNNGEVYYEAIYLSALIEENEGYEEVELTGNKYSGSQPLIQAEAKLNDDYFTKDINPILYAIYGLNSAYTINRDASIYGYKPSKAIMVSTSYLSSIQNNTDINWRKTKFPYRYDIPILYKEDYVNIRDRVLNDYTNGNLLGNSSMGSILDNEFLVMRGDDYDVEFRYVLPGDKLNSVFTFSYKNPFNFR